jgi:hypothetical protein
MRPLLRALIDLYSERTMQELKFLVKGSAADPYEVSFVIDGNNLSAFCTCLAGINGQYCKHRLGILSGETNGVVSDNVTDVSVVASWLPGTDIDEALKAVADAEENHAHDKTRLSAAKKNLARVMRN